LIDSSIIWDILRKLTGLCGESGDRLGNKSDEIDLGLVHVEQMD